LAFLHFNRDNDHVAIGINFVLKVAKRFWRRAIEHFSFPIEHGVVARADEAIGLVVPVDATRKVGAAAG
jgi:hypothetical protein